MQLSNQRIGGLVFLLLSLFYGYFSYDIQLFAGAEFEPFTPRTLPQFLAISGLVCSLALIIGGGQDLLTSLKHTQWQAVTKLLAVMFAYGWFVNWLGFVLATIFFLVLSFRLMGETKHKKAIMVAVIFTLVFWALLTQILDIYLEPGQLWHWFNA
ncbi:tripartite tricarboxylate transporter TctB family protein [Agarivorans sp. QJM3NY_29]